MDSNITRLSGLQLHMSFSNFNLNNALKDSGIFLNVSVKIELLTLQVILISKKGATTSKVIKIQGQKKTWLFYTVEICYLIFMHRVHSLG